MKAIIMMPFLYFPEDKTEYIPAGIAMIIFMTLAVIAMRLMMKKSKKDEEKFNEKYKERLDQARHNDSGSN